MSLRMSKRVDLPAIHYVNTQIILGPSHTYNEIVDYILVICTGLVICWPTSIYDLDLAVLYELSEFFNSLGSWISEPLCKEADLC